MCAPLHEHRDMTSGENSALTELAIGAAAGACATIPMSWAMEVMHHALSRLQRHPLPPRQITDRLLDLFDVERELTNEQEMWLSLAAHLGYGAAVGYDMQMGGAVVGLEAEYSDSDNRTCVGSATVADPRVCLKSGRDLYAGGRVGTVVGGSTLLYAKAGYTNAQAKLTSDDGTGHHQEAAAVGRRAPSFGGRSIVVGFDVHIHASSSEV